MNDNDNNIYNDNYHDNFPSIPSPAGFDNNENIT